MGRDLLLPGFPKIRAGHYLTIIVFFGLLNASLGLAYVEAKSSAITVLQIDGAPENIVFIADPHLKEGNAAYIHEIIGEINALSPSVVLIGGDFVFGEGEDLHLQEVWEEIDAPVYAILGNHDYRSGITATSWVEKNLGLDPVSSGNASCGAGNPAEGSIDPAFAGRLTSTLEENGVTVLRNEYRMVDAGGEELMIVGIDDGWAGMADPPDVPATGAYTLYLIHEPECRADWDCDLVLAGHTHGGQFLPQNTPLPGFELSGLSLKDGISTYITRGIGTSNLGVELRLFATPEIVVINPTTPPESLFPGKEIDHLTIS